MNKSEYNMNYYDTSQMITKESNLKISSNIFKSLIPNKSFKKFLKTRHQYYMDDADISKMFIINLKYDENKNNTKLKDISKNKSKIKSNIRDCEIGSNFKSFDYSNFDKNKYRASKSSYTLKNNINQNNSHLYNKSMKNFYRNYNRTNNYYNFSDNDITEYNKIFIENKLNKEKIYNLKKELKNKKYEMKVKNNKLNILQHINNNLRNEIDILQLKCEFEIINNKKINNNYNKIKNNYSDMKNQYDLLNLKYITLKDENFNFQRNIEFYEKQIKDKNEMIENLIENKTKSKKKNIDKKLNKINSDKNKRNERDFIKNSDKNKNHKDKLKNKGKEVNKNLVDYNKYDRYSYRELLSKRDELKRERENANNIFSKIPFKSPPKEQIIKKNNLEKKINEINCDLMIIRLRLKNLKNNNN